MVVAQEVHGSFYPLLILEWPVQEYGSDFIMSIAVYIGADNDLLPNGPFYRKSSASDLRADVFDYYSFSAFKVFHCDCNG